MGSDTTNSSDAPVGGKPLSAAARKRLQTYFQYGEDKQKAGDHDYAHSMYAQCVVADPANLVYVEAMLTNLVTKHKPKKKKAKVRSSRSAFKKAVSDDDWGSAVSAGVELLKENPWDLQTLRGMAEASAGMRMAQDDERFNEIELRYLKAALEGSPNDVELNRHIAESLTRKGQFDQAISRWHKLETLLPNKSEAHEKISELTVLKNMKANGMLDEELAKKAGVIPTKTSHSPTPARTDKPSEGPDGEPQKTPRARLEKAIVDNPTNLTNYIELAKLHESAQELKEAEAVLRRALAASGSDLKIAERLEAVQVRRAKQQVASAEKQFASRKDEESKQLVLTMREELNRLELGIYQGRSERYPDHAGYRYELAVRLKRAQNFDEAVKYFEDVATDEKFGASAEVQRGECFQKLRKYQEAMQAYQAAVKLTRDETGEVRKLSLYRSGALAMGLKNWILARDLLEKLVKMDPNYQDAAARLDKLKEMDETQ